ncbi:hypothetical protein [Fibrisoma limi]|uniref:hypothetical protein n=1 Tax=Fibrisoma limi TaxID=663275 RepID=UPI0005872AB8|nr:hypothetical protein [Fibrisoma limi]
MAKLSNQKPALSPYVLTDDPSQHAWQLHMILLEAHQEYRAGQPAPPQHTYIEYDGYADGHDYLPRWSGRYTGIVAIWFLGGLCIGGLIAWIAHLFSPAKS